jgi:hypothetical protein
MGSHGALDTLPVTAVPTTDHNVLERRVSGADSRRGYLAAAVGPCLVDVSPVSYSK